MRSIRSKRAFTLIELIIVIVILGILAGIAIVGYQAVINRAKDSQVEQAASSFGRQYRALAAFDSNYAGGAAAEALILESRNDLPAGVDVLVVNQGGTALVGVATGTVAADIANAPAAVLFSKDGSWACLTLPQTNTGAATVVSGRGVIAAGATDTGPNSLDAAGTAAPCDTLGNMA